jgi:hypothetical protein
MKEEGIRRDAVRIEFAFANLDFSILLHESRTSRCLAKTLKEFTGEENGLVSLYLSIVKDIVRKEGIIHN